MNLIRVGAASLRTIPLHWQHNFTAITDCISEARRREIEILCLPELCLTGYGCEDAFFGPEILQTALSQLLELAPHTLGMVVCVGLPISCNKSILNCACVLADGRILGFVPKKNLAGDGVHYEPRWFKPARDGVLMQYRFSSLQVPLGDLVFDFQGVRLGFEICEDAWSISRPGNQLAKRGVDIILNPSASHFSLGKAEVRQRFVTEASRAFGAVYLYANLQGCESNRIVYDGGPLIASEGKIRAVGERFSCDSFSLVDRTIDIDFNRSLISRVSSLTENFDDRQVIFDTFYFQGDAREDKESRPPQALTAVEELEQVLLLGLKAVLKNSNKTMLAFPEGSDELAHHAMLRLCNLDPALPYKGILRAQGSERDILFLSSINRSQICLGLWDRVRESLCDLAPFGGVSQSFLLKWLNQDFENQTLLGIPLPVLDELERAFVLKRRGPAALFQTISNRFPEISARLAYTCVREFVTAFCSHSSGRERLPASFHLDEQSLDTHLWFRYPVFNGGFELELEQLGMMMEAGQDD